VTYLRPDRHRVYIVGVQVHPYFWRRMGASDRRGITPESCERIVGEHDHHDVDPATIACATGDSRRKSEKTANGSGDSSALLRNAVQPPS